MKIAMETMARVCVRVLALAAATSGLENISVAGVKPGDIQPEKELFITDPFVVDSFEARYPGPWSFGALITELAGKKDPSEFTRAWLETWVKPVIVNDQIVPARSEFIKQIIEPWQRKDGYDPDSGTRWLPNLANAPFRLLAIVNRMDLGAPVVAQLLKREQTNWEFFGVGRKFAKLLRQSDGASSPAQVSAFNRGWLPLSIGGGSQGGYQSLTKQQARLGEGRLIFGAIDSEGKPHCPGWTLIFEYRLPETRDLLPVGAQPNACATGGVQAVPEVSFINWAQRWHALGDYNIRDQRFVAALSELTRLFTHRRLDDKGNPIGTVPLAQIRSNEALFGRGREFRQFELVNDALQLAPLPQTPAPEFMETKSRESRALAAFLRDQQPLYHAGLGSLPVALDSRGKAMPLLAGRAVVPEGKADFRWEFSTVVGKETRRVFSLNTCNGCHAGETNCIGGFHVYPRLEGSQSVISGFLGAAESRWVVSVSGNVSRESREIQDRAAILAALLNDRENSRDREIQDILRKRIQRTH